MKNTIAVLLLVALTYALVPERGDESAPQTLDRGAPAAVLEQALARRLSDIQVEGEGVVVKVLADDREGSRHQRFILRLASGQTLLVAHNIDLAPRIPLLREGDRVAFYGEYEWNPQGGVVHWTHRDPAGRHVAGWLRLDGALYQ